MDSFCIDLSDSSTTSAVPYKEVNLEDAADPTFGPMGIAKATWVKKLWDMAYSSGMSQNDAAALQVAIWEVVADDTWDLTAGNFTVGTDAIRSLAGTLLTNVLSHDGQANLGAVSNPVVDGTQPQYQDYVVQTPEPATLLFLGAGLLGLGILRRRA